MSKCCTLLSCICLSVKCGTVHVRNVHLHGKLVFCDLTYHFSGCKNARQISLQWILGILTLAYKGQLDDSYSAL